jgi:hypothetical protein
MVDVLRGAGDQALALRPADLLAGKGGVPRRIEIRQLALGARQNAEGERDDRHEPARQRQNAKSH